MRCLVATTGATARDRMVVVTRSNGGQLRDRMESGHGRCGRAAMRRRAAPAAHGGPNYAYRGHGPRCDDLAAGRAETGGVVETRDGARPRRRQPAACGPQPRTGPSAVRPETGSSLVDKVSHSAVAASDAASGPLVDERRAGDGPARCARGTWGRRLARGCSESPESVRNGMGADKATDFDNLDGAPLRWLGAPGATDGSKTEPAEEERESRKAQVRHRVGH